MWVSQGTISRHGLVIAIFFLSLLPAVVSSQEAGSTTTATTTVSQEAPTAEPDELIYKTEPLLGDRVFGDFVLGPGKIELEIQPGESRTVMLNVANRIGEPKIFNIEVEDMTGSNNPDQTVVLLGDDTGPYTLKDYISIPDRSFRLPHNLRALIPVTISIPPDAEPGGRYGSVLVNTVAVPAQAADSTTNTAPSSAIVSRIGTLFFITVPGDIETSGQLKEFETKNSQTFFDSGPIDFQILYENTGSVHLNPYGELRITNLLGEEVGFYEIEPWFTMPKAERLREISWDRDLLYGRYEATLRLNRGYDNQVDEMSISFWVIPWKLVALGLGVLFIVFFLIRSFFRKFEFKRRD